MALCGAPRPTCRLPFLTDTALDVRLTCVCNAFDVRLNCVCNACEARLGCACGAFDLR